MIKTQENLKAAVAGESQARNKYTFYAAFARKEGYHYIARILEETAENEKRHAKDGLVLVNGIGDTAASLKEAISGEHHETTEMYPAFAMEAKADENEAAARLLREIGEVEEHHRERFKRLLQLIESGMVCKRERPIRWNCSVCGYVHEGKEHRSPAPAVSIQRNTTSRPAWIF